MRKSQLSLHPDTLHFWLTSLIELKAYFGILDVRHALHLNKIDSDIVWYHGSSNPLFVCAMKRKRLSTQFDDVDTRSAPWKNDKFACFRHCFEQINNRFLALRLPFQHTAIDETLYPYRGSINFKQYNPSKPGRHGLL